MREVEERLRELDGIPAPELWPEIETRRLRTLPQPSQGRRLAIAAVALAVAGAAIGAASWALLRSTSPTTSPPSSVPTTLSPGPVAETFDGTVAFERSIEGSGVHVIVLDHAREHDLGPGAEPAWSPDGSRLAFLLGRGGGLVSLYLVNPDGSGRRRVATVGGSFATGAPAWSRDGSWIAVGTGPQGIVLVRPADGLTWVMVHRPGCLELDPAWSPTGDRLAYIAICDRGVPGSGIHVRKGGLRPRPGPVGTEDKVILAAGPRTTYRSLVWSPVGDRIAFKRTVVPATGPGQNHIFLVASDGSGARDLTRGPGVQDGDPSWSPDGSKLVFDSVGAGGIYYQIWVMDADGSDRKRVTFGDDRKIEDLAPAWRPGS
jgi:Tol biopolymer transport system component